MSDLDKFEGPFYSSILKLSFKKEPGMEDVAFLLAIGFWLLLYVFILGLFLARYLLKLHSC